MGLSFCEKARDTTRLWRRREPEVPGSATDLVAGPGCTHSVATSRAMVLSLSPHESHLEGSLSIAAQASPDPASAGLGWGPESAFLPNSPVMPLLVG